MGWDNASTIAQEVERPQRTYPRAMIAAVILVSLTYILPFVAVYFAGTPASAFTGDGSWAAVAGQLGGKIMGFEWLRFMVTIGGMMSAFGMFNALVMSYSRLPLAMARDGMMPKLFGKVTRKNHTPWVAIIVLATCWALCLGLGFKRLVTLDIMLYGAALMLEFVTLVVLRIREPKLRREFRVPGGMAGAVIAGSSRWRCSSSPSWKAGMKPSLASTGWPLARSLSLPDSFFIARREGSGRVTPLRQRWNLPRRCKVHVS